jgi:hypothetical protein
VATTAAIEAYRASRNRHCHRACGAPSPLVRFGSTVVACPPALGALSSLDPGGAPLSVARLGATPPLALEITAAQTREGTAATAIIPSGLRCFYCRPNLVRPKRMAPLGQDFL